MKKRRGPATPAPPANDPAVDAAINQLLFGIAVYFGL